MAISTRSIARQRAMRIVARVILACATAFGALAAGIPRSIHAYAFAGNVLYTPDLSTSLSASYPSAIRLQHSGSANGTILATFDNGELTTITSTTPLSFPVYQSADNGQTWSLISHVVDAVHGWDFRWEPTLFELPQTVGPYPAGTLLLAGNAIKPRFGADDLEVYRSGDHGKTWTYLSSCATQPNASPGHNIFEPDLQIDSAGHLVCYFSDERQSPNGYSQFLGHVVSTDGGQTWGSEVMDVGIQNCGSYGSTCTRPGVATVIKLPNGQYLMSFEVVSPPSGIPEGEVFVKTSTDGDNWGSASDLGSAVQTGDGRYLRNVPSVVWSPAGEPNGEVIAAGHNLYANGADAPESGRTLMVNYNLGVGPWYELTAPLVFQPQGIAFGDTHACAGWHQALVPSADGSAVLQLAPTLVQPGHCDIRFATANAGVFPYSSPFVQGTDTGWSTFNGSWSVSSGVYSDSSVSPGDQAVAGSTGWGDYTLEGDVELTSLGTNGNSGFLIRATKVAAGPGYDPLSAYYAGLDGHTGNIVLNREDSGSFTNLGVTALPGGVALNTWYHMTVQATGCTIKVFAERFGTSQAATLSATDSGCTKTQGQIGVRAFDAAASWGNISVESGLVGQWSFDEGSGGTAFDSSGNAQNGTLVGSPAWTTGHTNTALDFNGSSSYVDAGANVAPTNGDFSVAAWVRLDAATGYHTAVSEDGSTVSGFYLQRRLDTGKFAFTLPNADSTSVGGPVASSTTTPVLGTWYYLVGVRDTGAGQIRLYVNGNLEGTAPINTGWSAGGHLEIGRAKWAGAASDFWPGAIDEVHVYNRVLSNAEIAALASL